MTTAIQILNPTYTSLLPFIQMKYLFLFFKWISAIPCFIHNPCLFIIQQNLIFPNFLQKRIYSQKQQKLIWFHIVVLNA